MKRITITLSDQFLQRIKELTSQDDRSIREWVHACVRKAVANSPPAVTTVEYAAARKRSLKAMRSGYASAENR